MKLPTQVIGICTLVVASLANIASSDAQSSSASSTCRWVPGRGWQCPIAGRAPDIRRSARPQQPAEEIVRVIVPHADGSGSEDRGSGVLVFGPDEQHGWVLTAEHVMSQRREAIVEFPNGQRYRGTVVASDRTDDVALLRIAKPSIAPRRVAEVEPTMGAEVYLAGYPQGGTYRSWLTRRTKVYEASTRLEVAGHAENGTSGGPMIDARGRVVSVISTTQRAGTQQWTTSGCSTARLRKLLRPKPKRVPIQKQTPRPPATPAPPEIDYDRLASLVAAKMPQPLAGKQGQRGEPGPRGSTGPPGRDTSHKEIAQLNRRITELEQTFKTNRSSVPAYFEIVPRGK
jgi:hypothetical protein